MSHYIVSFDVENFNVWMKLYITYYRFEKLRRLLSKSEVKVKVKVNVDLYSASP